MTYRCRSLTLSTADSERGAFDLERVAHAMEVELKRVPAPAEVTTIGGPGRKGAGAAGCRQAQRLRRFAAGNPERAAVVERALPSGNLVSNNQQIEIQTGNWLGECPRRRQSGGRRQRRQPVYLSDVARIVDGPISRGVMSGLERQRPGGKAQEPDWCWRTIA